MERLEKDDAINSVHPLLYWEENTYKCDMQPEDYFIAGRGSSFLFKTETKYYLITTKHNFTNKTTNGIVNEMNSCYILRNYNDVINIKCIDDFNSKNVLKLRYLPFSANDKYKNLFDLCIFEIFENFPDNSNCLEYYDPDHFTEDLGYAIGFPQKEKSIEDYILTYTKVLLHLEISNIIKKELLIEYKYNSKLVNINKINGFSGGPIVQYSPKYEKYILTGMVMLASLNTIKAIPAIHIFNVIKEIESKDITKHRDCEFSPK